MKRRTGTALPFSQLLSCLKLSFFTFLFILPFKNSACEQTLTISAALDWAPYSYVKNDKIIGLDIEILSILLPKSGFCWKFKTFPSSSRAFAEFKKGKVDLIFAASISKERASYAQFSSSYRNEVVQLFTHKKHREIEISSVNWWMSLNKHIVAVNRGSVYGSNFEHFVTLCPDCIVETNLATERFNLIKYERVEFAVEDLLAGTYLIEKLEYAKQIEATDIAIHRNPVYYMIRPGVLTHEQHIKFNEVIEDSAQAIQKIVDKYYKELGLSINS